MNPDESIPTRQSLLSRLKNWDDQESWRQFFDTYWQLIHRVARKAGLHEDEAQEVVQETILSVAKKMPTFKYDRAQGSFRGWLFQLIRWRILNEFKKRPPQNVSSETALPAPRSSRRAEAQTRNSELGTRNSELNQNPLTSAFRSTATEDGSAATPIEEIPDPAGLALDALWDEEWRQHVLTAAIVRVKAQVSPSQYQMFDLHVNQRLSVSDVSRALGVSAAQIYLAKHRIGRLLRSEVKKLEKEGR